MAPRQTARRLLVAAPALALAFAVTACSPPNEQPGDPDAPYTLPTYTGDADAPDTEATADTEDGDDAEATTTVEVTDVEVVDELDVIEGGPLEGAPGEEDIVVEVPFEELPGGVPAQ